MSARRARSLDIQLERAEGTRIVEQALLVLERTGVRVEHGEGRALLLAAGNPAPLPEALDAELVRIASS